MTQRNTDGQVRLDGAADAQGTQGAPSAAPSAHMGVWQLLSAHWSGRPARFFVGAVAVLLAVLVLMLPSAYVVETPGPTQDVLGDSNGTPVIQVEGAKTYHDKGRLLLVTVNAAGVPGYPVSNAEALWAWADPNMELTPQEAVFPVGQNAEQYQQESDQEMESSQDAAVTAGLDYAQHLGVDVDGVKVTMHVDDIGGPSAGMMYALGLVDMLTPEHESGKQTVAGTGTIDDEGKVGAIGGIDLKMRGAKRDGATWFLAPADNCAQVVGKVPVGLRDVKVSSLEDAYTALVKIGNGQADSLPHCTVE